MSAALRFAFVLAVVHAAGMTRGPAASGLPPWAAAIAETAPAAASGDGDTRILLSMTRVEVQPNGTLLVRRLLAIQALRDQITALEMGYGFGEASRIRRSKAWHLPPHGKGKRSREEVIDLGADDSYLTDRKIRVIPVTGIEKGSLAFFEFEALESPVTLGYQHPFYEGAPTDVARFELALPPAWKARSGWLGGEGPTPAIDGSVTVWELRGLPGRRKDLLLGESEADRAPMLVVVFSPPDGGALHGTAVIDTWVRFAKWYEDLGRGRDAATPDVSEAARAATAGAGADWFQKVRSTALYVRDRVRYLDRELGIGGYQPHPAAEVLHEKLGDCKDKGTLFRAMLAAGGIRSNPILVDATADRTVSDEIPSAGAFDHYVVGVPVPEDAPVPEDMRSAVLPLDGGGRLILVDVTDELTPIGSVSASLAGKRALFIDGARSLLITLPAARAAEHRIERVLSAKLLEDGSLELRESVLAFGAPASQMQAAWRASHDRFLKQTEREIARRWPGGQIVEHTAQENYGEGGFLEALVWRIPSWPPAAAVPLFSESLDDLPRSPLHGRGIPVVYPFPMTLRCETTLTGLATDTVPPVVRNATGEGWSVRTSSTQEDSTIHASMELTLQKRRFETKEFDELRKFWDAARQAASATVPLRKPPPTAPRT